MTTLLNAIHKAAKDTAAHMTVELRARALEHGWDADVVKNTHIQYSNGAFSLRIHPDYTDRAFVHEYGNETLRPTAVLRRYEHQLGSVSDVFDSRLNAHLGGRK